MKQEIETRNAKIKGFSLGYEDHGILTMFLNLDYGGAGQGFGGYMLDTYQGERGKGSRVGTAYGMEFVVRVLKTVGVDDIKDLVGKPIRVRSTWTKVNAIGHFIEDKWFDPDMDLVDFIPKEAGRK